MTYREALGQAVESLREAGVESAEAESRLMMESVCRFDLGDYLLHSGDEMPAELSENYAKIVKRRCTRMPLQYLTGEQEFMGLTFRVDEHVLIPRQDTEILAEEAVRILNKWKEQGISRERESLRVLDLCTGSGCIAITIKSFCPDVMVSASDISVQALRMAKENAGINQVYVEWIQGDLFSQIDGAFDLILCNPPYIPTDVFDSLMPEVRNFEPRIALDGGADGLSFYRRLFSECGPYIRGGGLLLAEIGSDQADAVSDMMRDHGFEQIRILKDLSGLDRVAVGRRIGDV